MKNKIGISDIQLYVPSLGIDLQALKKERIRWKPRLERHLDRAIRVTGQRKIRFPSINEDTATLAAEAAYDVVKNMSEKKLAKLRFLAAGTESGVDHSKPLSAYVEGMLQKSGLKIPENIASFQVQHACAGGTMALLSVAGLLYASGQDSKGLVLASDISRYETETTAEITQGAGAAALLVETDPKLLELDLGTQGYCSRDVDDFFRPLDSKTAKVKGPYSMECYYSNLKDAFAEHCKLRGESPADVLNNTDMFVLHAPFANMPESAMNELLKEHFGYNSEQSKTFLSSKGFYTGTDAIADIGNTYTASMYMVLAHLLAAEYKKSGDDIIGKNILMASYGSGNTMIVYKARVAKNAPKVISGWDLDTIRASEETASWADYQVWLNASSDHGYVMNHIADSDPSVRNFALTSLRKDGYREYAFVDQVAKYREKPDKNHLPNIPDKLAVPV
jgi:hydroxymethylglutaryl-CoA synthase